MSLQTKSIKQWLEYVLNRLNVVTPVTSIQTFGLADCTAHANVSMATGRIYHHGNVHILKLSFELSAPINMTGSGLPFIFLSMPFTMAPNTYYSLPLMFMSAKQEIVDKIQTVGLQTYSGQIRINGSNDTLAIGHYRTEVVYFT